METRSPDAFVPPAPWPPADLEQLGEEIAELSAHLEAATARLLHLIREFDARQGWNNGFASCAHWLGYKVGLDPGAARERVRVARAVGTLPLIAAALGRGELSYAKVRALTRVATPATEARLLALAQTATAAQVERVVRGWRRVDRQAEADQADQRHRSRALTVYHDDDGMVVIRGRLEPEAGALVLRALEAAGEALYLRGRRGATATVAAPCAAAPAAEPLAAADSTGGSIPGAPTVAAPPPAPPIGDEPMFAPGTDPASARALLPVVSVGDEPTPAQRQADALVLLAESALRHALDPGPPGDRYQVVVHVDAPVLADPEAPGQSVLEEGDHVSAETSQRLACDASRVVMRHDAAGHVLDVGRRTRTISPALRRALLHRDRGCRFPGCGRRFVQGHHLRHWAQGGPTTLENLTLVCRWHHRAVHEGGVQVARAPDGALEFRRPDGRLIPAVPPPVSVARDPIEVLRARNQAQGLRLDGRSLTPSWLGERLDLGWALDVLHPLANPGVPAKVAEASAGGAPHGASVSRPPA